MERPSEKLIETCMVLWNRGLDTKAISLAVGRHEAVVERAVWMGRERRREEARINGKEGRCS